MSTTECIGKLGVVLKDISENYNGISNQILNRSGISVCLVLKEKECESYYKSHGVEDVRATQMH